MLILNGTKECEWFIFVQYSMCVAHGLQTFRLSVKMCVTLQEWKRESNDNLHSLESSSRMQCFCVFANTTIFFLDCRSNWIDSFKSETLLTLMTMSVDKICFMWNTDIFILHIVALQFDSIRFDSTYSIHKWNVCNSTT